MNMHIPSRQNIFREMRDYLMIALGMIMYGIGWTVFLLPNDITTGGVPGIASLVYFATGLPVQYVYFGINFLLLLLAIRILGWKFSIKTIFAVFTLTSFLPIIQQLTDGVHLLNDQPFMCHRSIFLWRRHWHCFLFERKYGRNGYYRSYH